MQQAIGNREDCAGQAQFARAFGISLDTLQNWEQGRREPTGPAKVLLRVASRHPEAVLDSVA